MKISELMLDMASGDASTHDVAIQQAVGKVNVSTAVYEAAYKISELPDGMSAQIVQEAAEVGLPTDATGACGMACEAVMQQLTAYLDVVAETAKKVKASAEKELKLFITVGKKFGVNATNKSNFATAFATPFAKSIINDNDKAPLDLNGKKFLKAKYSAKLAANYCKGATKILSAYGVSINDVFADAVIAAEYGKHTAKEDATTMKEVLSCLSDGGKLVAFDKIIDKDRHYTETVKEADITALVTSLYIIIAVSTSVIDVIGDKAKRKATISNVRAVCEETCSSEDKHVNKTLDDIATSAKDWTEKVTSLTDNITKGFTDSTYAMMETLNGGSVAE